MQCLPLERCSSCPSSTRDRLCELWRRIRLEFTIEVIGGGNNFRELNWSRLVLHSAAGRICSNGAALSRAANWLPPPHVVAARWPALALLQLPMLLARWKQVLFGAIFQYVHAIFTQLAHRMHQPQAEPLGDIGFRYMPVRLHQLSSSLRFIVGAYLAAAFAGALGITLEPGAWAGKGQGLKAYHAQRLNSCRCMLCCQPLTGYHHAVGAVLVGCRNWACRMRGSANPYFGASSSHSSSGPSPPLSPHASASTPLCSTPVFSWCSSVSDAVPPLGCMLDSATRVHGHGAAPLLPAWQPAESCWRSPLCLLLCFSRLEVLPRPAPPALGAACQILRIISFTVTQLPAPNYHCRLGEETAVREMPEHWWGHVVVDLGRQVCPAEVAPAAVIAGPVEQGGMDG